MGGGGTKDTAATATRYAPRGGAVRTPRGKYRRWYALFLLVGLGIDRHQPPSGTGVPQPSNNNRRAAEAPTRGAARRGARPSRAGEASPGRTVAPASPHPGAEQRARAVGHLVGAPSAPVSVRRLATFPRETSPPLATPAGRGTSATNSSPRSHAAHRGARADGDADGVFSRQAGHGQLSHAARRRTRRARGCPGRRARRGRRQDSTPCRARRTGRP
jgi:hypothetical protein